MDLGSTCRRGGVAGFILGVGGALLSTGFTTGFDIIFKVPIVEMITYFLGSAVLSMILSILATIYPAYRAAKLNPVEALSYEL